jgi:hypothetical protein
LSWPKLEEPDRPRSLAARLGWMAAIWLLSVAALGLIATIIRWSIT